MLKLKLLKIEFLLLIAYALIQVASFYWRSTNLNYNTPFNDEAIYVVVGRMGLFQGDWQSYSAVNWMAGHPYFYTTIAALSYATKGIFGSRIFNVILGTLLVEVVFLSALSLSDAKKKERIFGGVFASFLIGTSPIIYYVSRLATYDMPGFYFLFLGFLLILLADGSNYKTARYYFFSVLFIIFALLIKIIAGIYLPLIVLYSYWRAKKLGKKNYYYWFRYFLLFLGFCLVIYGLFMGKYLVSYYLSQSGSDEYNNNQIFHTFWEYTKIYWYLYVVGTIGFILKKKWAQWLFLTVGASFVLLLHLATGRWFTLDKHTLGTVFFLSVGVGLGLSYSLSFLKSQSLKRVIVVSSLCALAFFVRYSSTYSKKFNQLWVNESQIIEYFNKNIVLGDKILVESGSGLILAVYEKDYPLNITTFDWFDYASLQGNEAYALAVNIGYFDYIQLTKDDLSKIPRAESVHSVVSERLKENYHLAFDRGHFLIYKRNF